jgi:hypothetical protein
VAQRRLLRRHRARLFVSFRGARPRVSNRRDALRTRGFNVAWEITDKELSQKEIPEVLRNFPQQYRGKTGPWFRCPQCSVVESQALLPKAASGRTYRLCPACRGRVAARQAKNRSWGHCACGRGLENGYKTCAACRKMKAKSAATLRTLLAECLVILERGHHAALATRIRTAIHAPRTPPEGGKKK